MANDNLIFYMFYGCCFFCVRFVGGSRSNISSIHPIGIAIYAKSMLQKHSPVFFFVYCLILRAVAKIVRRAFVGLRLYLIGKSIFAIFQISQISRIMQIMKTLLEKCIELQSSTKRIKFINDLFHVYRKPFKCRFF